MDTQAESFYKSDDLPDSSVCQIKELTMIKSTSLMICIHKQAHCPAALSFGYEFFCTHPRRQEISERTKKLLDNSANSF